MAKVKLKRLKIEKYRNVAPGTELVFNDRFNVLLGKNGTGKTTLLKLIAMVVASDFRTLNDMEFAFEYELAYPSVSVRVNIENRRAEDALGQLLPRESTTWSYQLELRIEGQAGHAESFYRAYEAGVQHVGEILRTKGLW